MNPDIITKATIAAAQYAGQPEQLIYSGSIKAVLAAGVILFVFFAVLIVVGVLKKKKKE